MLGRVLRRTASHFRGQLRYCPAETKPPIVPVYILKTAFRFCHSTSKTADLHRSNHLEFAHNGNVIQLHPFWLRDNCHCASCWDHATSQRIIRFQDIDPEIQPAHQSVDDDTLNITWPDGHKSSFPISWLLANDVNHTFKSKIDRVLWNGENYHELKVERMKYKDFMNDDECIKLLLQNVIKYGFSFVDEVPADVESTTNACKRISHLHETIFGKVRKFTGQGARTELDGTYFTNIALDAHTDLTSYQHTPGLQFFHCLYHDGTGGETLLEDGFYCGQKLLETDPDSYDLLANTPVRHMCTAPENYSESLDTVIRLHPYTREIEQLRFCNYRLHMSLPIDKTMKYYKAIGALAEIVEDQKNVHFEKLHPGTIGFVDNWRLLHGRRAYTGDRTLCGGYIERDSWMCKARYLGVTDH